MKRFLTWALLLVSASSAWAADDAAAEELTAFKAFIQEHPRALDELKKDPSLIGNPKFAETHQVVGEYLAKHPRVKDEVKGVPHFFDNLTATTRGGEHRKHPDGDRGAKK
jgi:hypothetical protein